LKAPPAPACGPSTDYVTLSAAIASTAQRDYFDYESFTKR
jgi:hypothetical protein